MSAPHPLKLRSARLFDPEAWKLLATFYRGKWRQFSLFLIAGCVQALLILPPLYIVRIAFDVAIPKGRAGLLIWLGVGFFASRILGSCVALAARSISLDITRSATADLRRDLVSALSALSREFYSLSDLDRIHSRAVHDSERIENMSNSLVSVIPALLASLALMACLLWLNWRLTSLLTLTVPLMWLTFWWSGRATRRAVLTFHHAFEDFSKGIRFLLSHIDLARMRGFEKGELERQTRAADELRNTGKEMAMAFALQGQVQLNLTSLAMIIVLVVGGLAIQTKMMSLGEFFAFYFAATLLTGNIDRITAALPELISGNESLLTLVQMRSVGPGEPYSGTTKHRLSGRVRLHNVSFTLAGSTILRDVSIEFQPGTTTAIVGDNGSGKTTLVNLILGFYRPSSGAVLADGVPYEEIHMSTLRQSIGVVPQQPTFFAGTVMENIGYGWPRIGPNDVVAAARRADADDFIQALPQGYDTPIGEGGARLSGGEAQKLAITRALLGRPKLLILDEPTNHLDLVSTLRIMNNLGEDREQTAILIVSHDPQIMSFSDTVVRIEAGVLVPEVRRMAGGGIR